MNEIKKYFKWLVDPTKKSKDAYIIINMAVLSVAITVLLFLLSRLLRLHTPEALKDMTISVATIIVSVVAIVGLITWKKQLKGKTDYEIARRYLRAVLRLRDTIMSVRNPFIEIDEMTEALRTHGLDINEEENNNIRNMEVYATRWKEVMDVVSDLEVEVVEAEISWGKEARSVQVPLRQDAKELSLGIKKYLGGYSKSLEDREIMYDASNEVFLDAFTTKLIKDTSSVENFLRKYLN